MAVFFRWSLSYFVLTTAVSIYLREDFLYVATRSVLRSINFMGHTSRMLPFFALLLLLAWMSSRAKGEFFRRIRDFFVMIALCCIFLGSFSSMKTSMPLILETIGIPAFYADPALAEFDKWLHFGTDPWIWTHDLVNWLGIADFPEKASYVYGIWWAVPAFYLPALIVLMGEEKKVLLHFVALYMFSWLFLGNVVALMGASGGPVFYDRIFEVERFAALTDSLSDAWIEASWIGWVQAFLWVSYVSGTQEVGSGISAFPSLHLASASVVALYLQRKGFWLGTFGWTFVAAIMFLSVWTGYHYAIDGYFSIIAVYVLHRYMLARQAWSLETGADALTAEMPSGDRGSIPAE